MDGADPDHGFAAVILIVAPEIEPPGFAVKAGRVAPRGRRSASIPRSCEVFPWARALT